MKIPTILVVDDEAINIKLMKGFLRGENYHIEGALSGEDALKIVAEKCPDLILLDVMMPGLDGFQVCEKLKQNEATKLVPIVMVTALTEKAHRVRAMEVGADDFLSKPLDQTELLVRVKAMLRIKSYQDELLHSYQEMTEKNVSLHQLEKEKEGLTHMIIHDLKGPLSSTMLNLQVALMQKPEFSEGQKKAIESCMVSCEELDQMIQGLLDIHRMDEGQLKLHKETTSLKEFMERLESRFTPQAHSKQITLSIATPDNGALVHIDAQLIKRVLANLLTNAFRHTPAGGKIYLSIDSPSENGDIVFTVRDNGTGLAPEYHERVFDKFEQVGLKREGVEIGSSGLGLAFCKMAVEAHGGRIWVESEGIGKGCTFRFSIPL